MTLATRIRATRTAVADRRTERIARRRLAAELAAYQTPAERSEFDQVLARHTTEETREIRAILDRQDVQRLHRATFVSGYHSCRPRDERAHSSDRPAPATLPGRFWVFRAAPPGSPPGCGPAGCRRAPSRPGRAAT